MTSLRRRQRARGLLRIDFITAGDRNHGVTRYSRIIAQGISETGGRVHEHILPGRPSLRSIAMTALRARAGDVVHVQLTTQYWGEARQHFWAVLALRAMLVGHPLVVTAHDFHTPRSRAPRTRRPRWLPKRLPADDAASRLLLGTASLVLTCSDAEADVLAWTRPRRTAVVDHFVEDRPGVRGHEASGLSRNGLVVLGYIHRRKGQLEAVRALGHLPNQTLVLAGTANERNGHYVREIEAEAEALRISDRLCITGYLSEDEMDETLAAARVGIAPYAKIAASGSLATLAAAGVPIVARRHPYLEKMALACPRGIRLYDGDSDESLAEAVRGCLAEPYESQRAELLAWAARHSVPRTGERHLSLYRSILRETKHTMTTAESA